MQALDRNDVSATLAKVTTTARRIRARIVLFILLFLGLRRPFEPRYDRSWVGQVVLPSSIGRLLNSVDNLAKQVFKLVATA